MKALSRALLCAPLPLALAAAPARATDAPPPDILVTAQKRQQTIENAPSTPRHRSTADDDRDHDQRGQRRGHAQISAQPARAQTPHRRHPGAARDAHLGPRLERAQPDLCRRRAALGADRQQQHDRQPALEPGQPAGDRADRRALRPLLGRLSGQFDRRGGQHHHPPARRAGGDGRPPAATSSTSASTAPHETLPACQIGGTIGDRFGPLALFASIDHVASHGQPLLYVTATQPATASAAGSPRPARYPALNRTGAPIAVLGASGIEHQVQDHIKLKAALDITPDIRLTYVGGLFLNDTACARRNLSADQATGAPAMPARSTSAAGPTPSRRAPSPAASIPTTSGTGAHALSATGSSGRFDWQVIGTLYDFAHDVQRIPTTRAARRATPAARARSPGSTAPAGRRSTPRARGGRTTRRRTCSASARMATGSRSTAIATPRPTGSTAMPGALNLQSQAAGRAPPRCGRRTPGKSCPRVTLTRRRALRMVEGL